MNTNPLVSVIVPTFNRALVLPRAIASVLKQDYGNLELIVVDDGSTDETERVVAALSDRRISYYRVEANRGPAAARNTGIVLARGDLIAFQDSDDEWLPGKLRKQVRTIAEEGDSAGFSYSSFWHEVNGLQQQIPSVSQITRRGNTFHRLLYGNFIGMPTLVVTRSCLELAGAFDETMRSLEDWDLMLRLSQLAEGVFIEEPLVLAHDSSSGVNSQETEVMLASLNVIYTHYAPEFHRDRGADAEMHLCMAIEYTQEIGFNNWGACVRHFALACLCDPSNVKSWVLFVASLTGPRSVVRVRQVFHRLKSGTARVA